MVEEQEKADVSSTEELPPAEYYDELFTALMKKFPRANPQVLEHVVSLASAFDTATAFGMSFGISKFQLAQPKVKLVGEIVGRQGRSPNPELVRAIEKWPKVEKLI